MPDIAPVPCMGSFEECAKVRSNKKSETRRCDDGYDGNDLQHQWSS